MDVFSDPQIRELFFTSADEYIHQINEDLLALETNPTEKERIESVFRSSHSLKSESLSMGYSKISELCHDLEDLFSILREGKRTLTSEGFTIIYEAFDFIQKALLDVKAGKIEPEITEIKKKVSLVVQDNLTELKKEETHTDQKLEFKPQIESIRVNIRVLDRLMNITEELLIEKMKLSEFVSKFNDSDLEELEKKYDLLISELQYYVTQLRLTPLEDVFQRFHRVVRDLSTALNKDVTFEMDLGGLKVDRLIAESIYEPILHLLKNSLDHGIESTEEREQQGKDKKAHLEIRATRERGLAVIKISDDGRGLDIDKLRKKLEEQGHENVEKLSEREVLGLVFRGGVSTAEEVTNLSGRGVGLNVVFTVMKKFGGKVSVSHEKGKGTTFSLEFPFTLAIIQALLVNVRGETYALPATHVVKTLRIKHEQLQEVADIQTIVMNEEEILLTPLSELFGEGEHDRNMPVISVSVVENGVEKLGVIVDEIIGIEEIIVKPLSVQNETNYFSGVTIVGNNKTALIIDVGSVINAKHHNSNE